MTNGIGPGGNGHVLKDPGLVVGMAPELSAEAKVAVRGYLIALVAIPSAVLSVITFTAGFFINDIYKEKVKASIEISKTDAIKEMQGQLFDFAKQAGKNLQMSVQAAEASIQQLKGVQEIFEGVKKSAETFRKSAVEQIFKSNERIAEAQKLIEKLKKTPPIQDQEKIASLVEERISPKLSNLVLTQFASRLENLEVAHQKTVGIQKSLKVQLYCEQRQQMFPAQVHQHQVWDVPRSLVDAGYILVSGGCNLEAATDSDEPRFLGGTIVGGEKKGDGGQLGTRVSCRYHNKQPRSLTITATVCKVMVSR
ncbi:MAG: hypothetical protein KIT16_10420 [Rhodospirillaceae bacterium]|nr:hypothetical protein [Rhodospirillaceae bacterium]